MVKTTNDLPKISLSSTKKEMLEAFKDLKIKLEEKAKIELNPEKKVEEKKIQTIVESVDSLSVDLIEKDISSLKLNVGKMLSQISEKLGEEIGNYKNAQEAINIKNKELQEIFEIEKSAFALAALIEAQKQKKSEFEIEMKYLKEELDNKIKITRIDWDKEKKEHTDFIEERNVEEKKKRDRAKEEYIYEFQREKQLAENKFKDEMKKQEKELAVKQEAFNKKFADMEKELKEREDCVQAKEQVFKKLQQETDTFPKRLETAVNKAVTETTAKLKGETEKDIALLKKGYEGEKSVLETKIESLQKLVADQTKQSANLSEKIEKAYGKVQDIALKAVEGSANMKAINSFAQISEKSHRQSQE
ncbi:MAG: hypothetical protein DRP78_04575 [Candidatus Omnitrophota bacterium]|nr:MAG: hypothetical protein DRP78_04575 [Candidatus Omnitrophota bacterium]